MFRERDRQVGMPSAPAGTFLPRAKHDWLTLSIELLTGGIEEDDNVFQESLFSTCARTPVKALAERNVNEVLPCPFKAASRLQACNAD